MDCLMPLKMVQLMVLVENLKMKDLRISLLMEPPGLATVVGGDSHSTKLGSVGGDRRWSVAVCRNTSD